MAAGPSRRETWDRGPRKSLTCGDRVVSAASRSPPFSDPARLIEVAACTLDQRVVPATPGQLTIGIGDVRQIDIQITREAPQIQTTPVVDAIGDLADEIDVPG